ncbi:MAG TPA: alpha/beta fold hydrolase [Polyangiaceae bacterium]|nr:alpha/beta fold hydrolase [Polyangiaceae bacterium]
MATRNPFSLLCALGPLILGACAAAPVECVDSPASSAPPPPLAAVPGPNAVVAAAAAPSEEALAPLLAAAPDPEPPLFGKIGDLPLVSGETIKDCQVEYRTLGVLNADKSNVVVWATWFSGITKDLVELVGPGRLVDSSKYHVVLVGALANGVSSSPSNSPQQPRLRFPVVTVHDMVESQQRLLTRVLGLSRVRAVMGISMGGMQAFQWGVQYPQFMDRLIPIVGSPRLAPYDLLLWQANLDAIEQSSAYLGGNYREQPVLSVVQQLADLNLTTFESYNKAKSREMVLEDRAKLAPPRFDANDRVRQLQAMMAHDIGKSAGGSLEAAAAAIKAKLLVVVNERDAMVTAGPALEFAKLDRAQTLVLKGDCGHKAPSCEEKAIATRIAEFLK